MPRYAISDIHGCLDNFRGLLDKINFSTSDTLYLLGDYIDRGPDSKGVIDFIWELEETGHTVHCLRGNHEQMALDNAKASLYQYYDEAFLQSFKAKNYHAIPQAYYDWMNELPYYFETEGYILAHAGLDLRQADPLTDTTSMLWIRECEKNVSFDWLDGRIVVHGHTPTPKLLIEYRLLQLDAVPVLNIDGGCVFADRPQFGYLCAINLDSLVLTTVKRIPHSMY